MNVKALELLIDQIDISDNRDDIKLSKQTIIKKFEFLIYKNESYKEAFDELNPKMDELIKKLSTLNRLVMSDFNK